MTMPPPLQNQALDPVNPASVGLVPSLGSLVRGLSCLFWGLPLVLVLVVQTAKTDHPRALHLWGTVSAFALVAYGIHLLGDFQRRERIWQRTVEALRIASLLNLGFCPFLFFWSRFPNQTAFRSMVDLLAVSFLYFLIELHPLLDRLVAMLPDEALREETRVFARMGRWILTPIWGGLVFYLLVTRFHLVPPFMLPWFAFLSEGGLWFGMLLALLPVALTMSLLWKIKELVFHSVFSRDHGNSAPQ